jgi:hypothetical protein
MVTLAPLREAKRAVLIQYLHRAGIERSRRLTLIFLNGRRENVVTTLVIRSWPPAIIICSDQSMLLDFTSPVLASITNIRNFP